MLLNVILYLPVPRPALVYPDPAIKAPVFATIRPEIELELEVSDCASKEYQLTLEPSPKLYWNDLVVVVLLLNLILHWPNLFQWHW